MIEMPEGMSVDTMSTVSLDGKMYSSDDFVSILTLENGMPSLFFQTDALTLGMSLQLVSKAFAEALGKCSEEERIEIDRVLSGTQDIQGGSTDE